MYHYLSFFLNQKNPGSVTTIVVVELGFQLVNTVSNFLPWSLLAGTHSSAACRCESVVCSEHFETPVWKYFLGILKCFL